VERLDEKSVAPCGIPVRGRSIAGQESYYRLPTLRSALEIGRCPESIVSIPNVFITHAHLDHVAGVPTYASQRTLQGLSTGRVHVPAAIHADLAKIVSLHLRLEGFDRYEAELVAVEPGERIEIRKDLVIRVFPGSHRIPTVGYTFVESRRKLKPELEGAPSTELAGLRALGRDISDVVETPLLSYSGDCDARIFDRSPEIFASRILLIECTFLRPGEEERAREYGHMHVSDIAARASEFRNEAILLTHFSAKYSEEEIRTRLDEAIPESLRERVTAFV
jgi:ribonuclease Z